MEPENTRSLEGEALIALLGGIRRIHFVGICGAGMRVLARMCHLRGYSISGSDADPHGEGGLALGLLGIVVEEGGPGSSVADAELVVYSTAVPKEHPELLAATRRGIPTVPRAALLGALMQAYRVRIGVAGTHGKSTVSAMCEALLRAAGRDPTAAIGARLFGSADGYRAGGEDCFVFEACEYRRAFLSFRPTVAVLTNAEWDHPDCFPDRQSVIEAFADYLRLPSVLSVAVSGDDPGAIRAARGLSVPTVTFGMTPGCDVCATEILRAEGGYAFLLTVRGQAVGRVTLRIPGLHNVRNALAAVAALVAAGVGTECAPEALSAFPGVGRRTEYRGRYRAVTYYDDYAHHPTEIRASLSALGGGGGRLICLYQPHTYSRTAELFSDFVGALSLADLVVLCDVYAAREERIPGAGSQELAAALGRRVVYFPSPEAASLYVRSVAAAGDTVVVMGAGDLSSRVFCGVLSFPES